MEEMLEDTLDIGDDEELEEEADAEVDKVLFELTDGKLGEAGKVSTELPVSAYSMIFIFRLRVTFIHKLVLEDRLQDEDTERNMEKYRQELSGLLSG
jgi:charged multivesicular body protein 3